MGLRSDEWCQQIDRKLDRLLNDVEFIKNRTATYLGRNEALTYLVDETPVFVNTDDFGCPLNFLNGGRYEEEYFTVLFSYRRPDSVFLDIGANLGVYSLRLAPALRASRIIAFEPIPRIRDLFSRSAFLNGYSNTISIQPFALSDHDGEATLGVPAGHTGGASLEIAGTEASETVRLRRLDDLMEADFRCDLVKIDVEGHELHVLEGARRIMERSHGAVVMFEKLARNSGIERGLADYARSLGWEIYGIDGVRLSKVDIDGFIDGAGYFVAGRPEAVEASGLDRGFYDIYPKDLNVLQGELADGMLKARATGNRGAVIFHGPYWFLPRGYYRFAIDAHIQGEFELDITERFGYKVHTCRPSGKQLSFDFPVYRDLSRFEVVLRSLDDKSMCELKRIRVTRIG